MTRFEYAKSSVSYREHCEDRLMIFSHDERMVVVVADGAGGIGCGAAAATTVIREIENEYRNIRSADQWSMLLKQIDNRIADGQSTAVVVDIRPHEIIGASVGDSEAWIIADCEVATLTQNQIRKPLLGSGDAQPVAFIHSPLNGLLIIGTDGFFNYAKRERVLRTIANTDFATLPSVLTEMVRLPSGELWDDTSIVVVRTETRQRTRQRYQL